MDLHVYRNSQDRWRDLRAAARARGAVLASNAVTLDELVERLTPDLKTASPAQRLVLVERAVEQAGSGVGGPSDGPEKEAREAGVPAVGRTVGPTLGRGVGGPSDGPEKEAREAGVPAVGRTVGPTLGNGVGGPSDGPFKEAAAK